LVGRLPLSLVGFTLAAFSGALVARGTSYSGRFSIHVVGVTVALVVCAIATLSRCLPSWSKIWMRRLYRFS
jgi:hypothetical protein